jgi:hypothetical protein
VSIVQGIFFILSGPFGKSRSTTFDTKVAGRVRRLRDEPSRGGVVNDPIRSFAQQYRVHATTDPCGESVINGKFGRIYEHSDDEFALVFEVPASDTRFDNAVRHRRRRGLAEGFQLHQGGDIEAVLLFNPAEKMQAKLAITLAGIKRKRISSPAQLLNLRRGPGREQPANTECAKARPVSLRHIDLGKPAGDASLSENLVTGRVANAAAGGKLGKATGNPETKSVSTRQHP